VLAKELGEEITPISEGQELIRRTDIENTPFELVEGNEGCFIGMGMFRLTEIESKEDVMKQVKNGDWRLITNLIGAMMAGRDAEMARSLQAMQKAKDEGEEVEVLN